MRVKIKVNTTKIKMEVSPTIKNQEDKNTIYKLVLTAFIAIHNDSNSKLGCKV
jgi:DNA-binding protein YbaB